MKIKLFTPQINYFQANNNLQKKDNAKFRYMKLSSQPVSDSVSFKQKNHLKTNSTEPSLEDFLTKFKNYEQIRISIKPKNLIGEGMHSKVFSFNEDALSLYVIKVIKSKKTKFNVPLNAFPEVNVGQPIYKVKDNIFILKKQNGKEHSVHNWPDVINGKKELTPQDAKKFCHDIKLISQMPDETFLDYAKKIQIIKQSGFKTDSHNPNNLLIDYKNKRINFIDFFPQKRYCHKDCHVDMIISILDFRLYPKYLKFLEESEKQELINSSSTIVNKCYTAAKQTKLSTNKILFKDFLKGTGLTFHYDFFPEYRAFLKYIKIP